jgi:hypothetical protein
MHFLSAIVHQIIITLHTYSLLPQPHSEVCAGIHRTVIFIPYGYLIFSVTRLCTCKHVHCDI